MLFIGIGPDLSDWILVNVKTFWKMVICQYENQLYERYILANSPGAQYRCHIRNGGYRP